MLATDLNNSQKPGHHPQPAENMKLWAVFALLCMWHGYVFAGAASDCEKLGFPNALCTDCDTMQEYVKDEDLLADCKRCCIKDQQDNTKYSSARLEICPYKLNGLPAIQDFVDTHAAQYSNLKVVKYVNSYPKLILADKASDKRISVRVDNWKVATFHEYLRERLEQPKATKR